MFLLFVHAGELLLPSTAYDELLANLFAINLFATPQPEIFPLPGNNKLYAYLITKSGANNLVFISLLSLVFDTTILVYTYLFIKTAIKLNVTKYIVNSFALLHF